MLVNRNKTARMLILIAVVAVTLTAITAVVYARVYNIGGGSWISCGTSAGDVQWDCPAGGGPCTSDPANDERARQFCALPPSPSEGEGEGGPSPVMGNQ
jgi:glyoxylate carboligase